MPGGEWPLNLWLLQGSRVPVQGLNEWPYLSWLALPLGSSWREAATHTPLPWNKLHPSGFESPTGGR